MPAACCSPIPTIAVAVATRSICATMQGPAGTKAVDASLPPARMPLPEPMRQHGV
ncbi:hypothetical protein AB0D59_20710 [Streptomyces sp. NPDC048417]|uniref:hypothetical protein n=1 Tax=Streptomyces sp. NPDC048417 TaxID=3155387 RepID=UPI0034437807